MEQKPYELMVRAPVKTVFEVFTKFSQLSDFVPKVDSIVLSKPKREVERGQLISIERYALGHHIQEQIEIVNVTSNVEITMFVRVDIVICLVNWKFEAIGKEMTKVTMTTLPPSEGCKILKGYRALLFGTWPVRPILISDMRCLQSIAEEWSGLELEEKPI